MLLREIIVDDHVVSLIQDGEVYIAKITDKNGDKILHNEYMDYEIVKNCFDKIVQAIDTDKAGIGDVMGILKRNQA